ncbi:hypothetical protein QC760_000177 [Botrytis cinerea]
MTVQCNGTQHHAVASNQSYSPLQKGHLQRAGGEGGEVADECDKGRLSGHSKRVLRKKGLRSTVTQCTASATYSDLATSCSFHLLRATKNLIKDQGFESETLFALAQGSSLVLTIRNFRTQLSTLGNCPKHQIDREEKRK